ncbi:HNH endonuclease family protein [Streptomyces sp. NPDC052236]|uniref:HNH endonuclease family protein n=1 Tax=Streptomyces sp. NPDC052236 TaxID=3365686 RepID=UPI0037D295D7
MPDQHEPSPTLGFEKPSKRTLFKHWVDADDDGCPTRAEVLISEATRAPQVGAKCRLSGGEWQSYYDGATWTQVGDVDIDHMVPLAEAWDSGASAWNPARREAYANDLGDTRSLVAVTDNANQAKADQDPAEWLPSLEAVHCRYVAEWTAVKLRWQLTADTAEKNALTRLAANCPDTAITVKKAT